MPALRRPGLCSYHARGRREDEHGIGVRPPQGSADCPLCRAEVAEQVAERDNGTSTRLRDLDAHRPDDDYPVQSPRARAALDRLFAARQRERDDHDAAIALMDEERVETIALDHARAGQERVDLYRRQKRLTKLPRPRWE